MTHILNSLLPATLTALDALSLNQKLLASNIANANTKGYSPSHLDFEAYMDSVLQNLDTSHATDKRIGAYVQQTSGEVQLDMELGLMSENLQKYKAIMDVLNRQTSLIQLAITGRGI
ncbi:flagellar basal body rod protein FlgB [Gynuella sunshinyii]|uniref:Flagellar basal body rod protein FlgB n=1 Tax=Gynuella sunshinyii YC6258 TaxID=1445510 RepID=A0A0C5VR58_9GAMM|nr:flagellar basal body protein [Gynuella sunshinyii]AJQ92719.1 flagellar basal body protein [Gynuella sunshinyii YC6258]